MQFIKCELLILNRNRLDFETLFSLRRVCDELTFTSPTGKLREDVSYVTSGLNELNIVTSKLKKQISYDNVAFNLMD